MFYPYLHDLVRQECPTLYRSLNPREYRGISEWSDTAIPAANLAGALAAPFDMYALLCAVTGARLIEHQTPHFFVSRDLALAVSQSDPPPGAKWTDIKLPFPAGIFMLPSGLVRDADGRRYDYVTWCRIVSGQPIPIPGGVPQAFANDAMVFTAASQDDPHFAGLTKTLDARTWPHAQLPPDAQCEEFSNLIAAERDCINTLARLCLGLLMAMEARPRLYTPGRRCRSERRRGGRRELWRPHILGADYRRPAPQPPAGGSHASPRLHWRRGHFRAQPVGPKRSERRLIWIEPMLVGAETAETED